nr:YggS family pyridoxal phosphate-dependent enzyme [Kineosphaera limosa]
MSAGLDRVHARIAAAAEQAGRDPAELTLVVVTKFFPAADVLRLAGLGVRDVGENRDQEAAAKATQIAQLADRAGLIAPRMHFIGQLQTNKAASVAGYAHLVHSLDRPKLARALSKAAVAGDRELGVLLQLGLDTDADAAQGRGGLPPAQARELADLVAELPGLVLRGVMGVAPLNAGGADAPDAATQAFARLRCVAKELVAQHPQAGLISAGMSGDLEQAVAAGATHLRVGSAILGSRPAHG